MFYQYVHVHFGGQGEQCRFGHAVFQPLTPILTAFITVLTGIELFNWYKCAGIAIACGGTMIVTVLGGLDSSDVKSFAYV